MKKRQVLNFMTRLSLFVLILGFGTMAALAIDETEGVALTNLANTSVQVIATTAEDDVVYVGLSGGTQPAGVYRSDDGGHTWRHVSSGPEQVINALVVDPRASTILYAGTVGGRLGEVNNLWCSEDSGQTWHHFNLSLPADPDRIIPAVTALAIDPNQPQFLYVGTDGHGVYRLTEGQIGFELVGSISMGFAHVKKLAMGVDSHLYALTNNGLFVTTGDDWQKLETLPETAISLAVAPGNPQTLYAGCPSSGAYRSADGGRTWEALGPRLGLIPGAALRVTALTIASHNPDHVVAGTAYGLGQRLTGGAIRESSDGGRTWRELDQVDGLVTELFVNQHGIYAATTDGLFHYGPPSAPTPVVLLPELHRLAHPNGVQMLILILAFGLAALALLGRTEWVTRHYHSHA